MLAIKVHCKLCSAFHRKVVSDRLYYKEINILEKLVLVILL